MWGTPGAPARLPLVEDGVQQKAWLCGSPDYFIEQLHELEVKYPGLEHVMFQYPEGMPLAEFKDQLRLLGEEVMPEFTDKSAAAAD
jgi:hypothetical protein